MPAAVDGELRGYDMARPAVDSQMVSQVPRRTRSSPFSRLGMGTKRCVLPGATQSPLQTGCRRCGSLHSSWAGRNNSPGSFHSLWPSGNRLVPSFLPLRPGYGIQKSKTIFNRLFKMQRNRIHSILISFDIIKYQCYIFNFSIKVFHLPSRLSHFFLSHQILSIPASKQKHWPRPG